MNSAINQHWAPQFYLEGFSTAPGSEKTLVIDVIACRKGEYTAKPRAIRKTAASIHLYSHPLPDGTFDGTSSGAGAQGWDDSVEKMHESIEREAGKLWSKFARVPFNVELSSGSEDRVLLCIFLANLHLRNPRMISLADYAADLPDSGSVPSEDQIYDAIQSAPLNLDHTLEGVNARSNFRAIQHRGISSVAGVLDRLQWTVHVFSTKGGVGPLVTSDTPLYCISAETGKATSLNNPKAVVFFPLNSNLMLTATGQPQGGTNGQAVHATKHLAEKFNEMTVGFARSEAYACRHFEKTFNFFPEDL